MMTSTCMSTGLELCAVLRIILVGKDSRGRDQTDARDVRTTDAS